MFAKLRARAVRFRTVVGAGALGVVGSLSILGEVDLQPLLALFIHDEAKLGALMVCIAIFFGVLRYYSPTVNAETVTVQVAPLPADRGIDEGE